MIASTIGGALNIVLNYFFIKMYGFIVAGYTTLFCYIFYAIVHYVFMRKIQKENMDNVRVYNPMIVISISSAFMLAAAFMMATYNLIIVRYGIILVGFIVLYIKRKCVIGVIKEVRKKN